MPSKYIVKKKMMGGKTPPKEMPGGGDVPMYAYGGKVFKGAEGLITALAKDPKNYQKKNYKKF